MILKKYLLAGIFLFSVFPGFSQRLRDLGIIIGVLKPGKQNSVTDVKGIRVGHTTLIFGDSIRTGVTAILPHDSNLFQNKVPAAIYIGNGFGKLMGYSQVKELGNIETPLILTNTLSVPVAAQAVIEYTLSKNKDIHSVNPVVGETNDGKLNDIRGMQVQKEHVFAAIRNARSDSIAEGNVGAGTGTVCFGFKGGIGTSSRKLPENLGGYTVGVLVQTNFGGVLQIQGVPIGVELGNYMLKEQLEKDADGSCMIVVATDAPLTSRNLERLAKRALFGLAKTGGVASNGSGDYVIAFSTNEKLRIFYKQDANKTIKNEELSNEAMTPLFLAVIEATEEAIHNSLFAAKTMKGYQGAKIEALPKTKVVEIMKNYKHIQKTKHGN